MKHTLIIAAAIAFLGSPAWAAPPTALFLLNPPRRPVLPTAEAVETRIKPMVQAVAQAHLLSVCGLRSDAWFGAVRDDVAESIGPELRGLSVPQALKIEAWELSVVDNEYSAVLGGSLLNCRRSAVIRKLDATWPRAE